MVAKGIIEQIRMAALIRIGDIVMAIMIHPFLALACLCSAHDLMALPALGSFAHVTSVAAVVVTARLAVTIIHC